MSVFIYMTKLLYKIKLVTIKVHTTVLFQRLINFTKILPKCGYSLLINRPQFIIFPPCMDSNACTAFFSLSLPYFKAGRLEIFFVKSHFFLQTPFGFVKKALKSEAVKLVNFHRHSFLLFKQL